MPLALARGSPGLAGIRITTVAMASARQMS